MTQCDLVMFAFAAFTQVKGAQFGIVAGSVKGALEESRAQRFDAALTHFGLAFPLAALAQPRVVAHKGLEAGGRLAIAPGMQDFVGQKGQDFVCTDRSEAGDGFKQRFALWIHALSSLGFDLAVQFAGSAFSMAATLWSMARRAGALAWASSGSAMEWRPGF